LGIIDQKCVPWLRTVSELSLKKNYGLRVQTPATIRARATSESLSSTYILSEW